MNRERTEEEHRREVEANRRHEPDSPAPPDRDQGQGDPSQPQDPPSGGGEVGIPTTSSDR